MKTILVTGGAGFIGSHTCLVLLQNGFKIIILDNFSNSNYDSIERIKKITFKDGIDSSNHLEFINGDIRDENLLNYIFERNDLKTNAINGVIHFAGLKSISDSISNPINFWEQNFVGTLILLKSMAKNNCKKIVFSSSATVYGSNYKSSLKESFLNFPINPYGETKNSIEKMLQNLYLSDKEWRIINLRYFNPIGAHSSGLLGENLNSNTDNLFPLICKVAAGRKKELKIFGNDWPTRDGTCIRDYVHVMDIADGHINALNFLLSSKNIFTSINLGTGKNTTVLELVKVFERVNNIKINYSFNEKRKGDPPILFANISLAKRLLKWKPKKSIEDMCKDGWKWYQLKNF